MRTLLLASVLVLIRTAVAQPIIETDIDHDAQPPQYVLVIHPLQTTLYGPDLPGALVGARVAGLTGPWRSDPLWAIPAVLGMGIDMANYRKQGISANAAVDELAARFDYFGETRRALDSLDVEMDWPVSPIFDIDFRSPLDGGGWYVEKHAKRVLGETGADAVIFLHFVYFMSPDLLQVRTVASMKTYHAPRKKKERFVETTRHFEYLSPRVGDVCRRWEAGQRERVAAYMERTYQDKLTEYPHNRAAYTKDRELALKAIADSVIMPPAMVFTNCWPDDTLTEALRLGIAELVEMIRADHGLLVPNSDRAGTKVSFAGLSLKGKPRKFKGLLMYENQRADVVRLNNGDVYSVPKSPGSP